MNSNQKLCCILHIILTAMATVHSGKRLDKFNIFGYSVLRCVVGEKYEILMKHAASVIEKRWSVSITMFTFIVEYSLLNIYVHIKQI